MNSLITLTTPFGNTERQAVIDLQVDGELMLRFEDGGRLSWFPSALWECHWIRTEKGFSASANLSFSALCVTEGDAPDGQDTENRGRSR